MVQRLEGLLVVPEGKRRSELDRLRRPPFSPTINGLVQARERLGEVRALGVEAPDLSRLRPRRVAGDDVLDIFDVVFGNMQRARHQPGPRSAGPGS